MISDMSYILENGTRMQETLVKVVLQYYIQHKTNTEVQEMGGHNTTGDLHEADSRSPAAAEFQASPLQKGQLPSTLVV